MIAKQQVIESGGGRCYDWASDRICVKTSSAHADGRVTVVEDALKPGFHLAVEALELAGGDRTGMWMLNYPFPYDEPAVADTFAVLARRLAQLVRASSPAERGDFWRRYERFLARLSVRDRRYFGFQAWQEGVARYVELRAAQVASRTFTPSPAFQALSDFQPFAAVAARLRADLLRDLDTSDLASRRRESFYSFGAALAILLDADGPDWKARYLADKFTLERYRSPAH